MPIELSTGDYFVAASQWHVDGYGVYQVDKVTETHVVCVGRKRFLRDLVLFQGSQEWCDELLRQLRVAYRQRALTIKTENDHHEKQVAYLVKAVQEASALDAKAKLSQ